MFGVSNEKIAILTLLSKEHLDEKQYVLRIEVVLNRHAESTAKKRIKEGYVNDKLCLNKMGISPPLTIELNKNKRFEISFDISGCLEPKVPLRQGQNRLVFDGSKTECWMPLALSVVPAVKPHAEIHFHGKDAATHLHQVIINVPRDSVPIPAESAEDSARRDFSMSTISSDSVPGRTGITPDPEYDYFGGRSTGSTTLSESFRNLTFTEPRCRQLLSEKSLGNLANVLNPENGFSLLIQLGVPQAQYNTSKANNPGDIVKATVECLVSWYSNVDGTEEDKIKVLIDCLGQIGRNDLKIQTFRCYEDTSCDCLKF